MRMILGLLLLEYWWFVWVVFVASGSSVLWLLWYCLWYVAWYVWVTHLSSSGMGWLVLRLVGRDLYLWSVVAVGGCECFGIVVGMAAARKANTKCACRTRRTEHRS